ncbi:MAG TPA: hypothetical protein VEL47_00635 [Myxococcota bacterium]|nr:hypothetical protein [Myxococcota bacterium]
MVNLKIIVLALFAHQVAAGDLSYIRYVDFDPTDCVSSSAEEDSSDDEEFNSDDEGFVDGGEIPYNKGLNRNGFWLDLGNKCSFDAGGSVVGCYTDNVLSYGESRHTSDAKPEDKTTELHPSHALILKRRAAMACTSSLLLPTQMAFKTRKPCT